MVGFLTTIVFGTTASTDADDVDGAEDIFNVAAASPSIPNCFSLPVHLFFY